MARKLIGTFTAGKHTAKVYRDAEWNEYRTRFYVDGILNVNADAFTPDKAEALQSAQSIIDRMHAADAHGGGFVFTNAPTLDHDVMMQTRYSSQQDQRMRNERRIVWNLLERIQAAGFKLAFVDDGEEETKVTTSKEAMELCFNLDDCHVMFSDGKAPIAWVRFIFGNGNDGKDLLCDYTVNLETAIGDFDFDACVAAHVSKAAE